MTTTIDFGPNQVGSIVAGVAGDRDSVIEVPAVGEVELPDGAGVQLTIGHQPTPEEMAEIDDVEQYGAWLDKQPMLVLDGLANVPAGAITSIFISDPNFDDAGAAHVATLSGVTELMVPSDKLSAASVAALASIEGLESFQLPASRVTDAELSSLAVCYGLRSLAITGPVTTEGVRQLSALPLLATLSIRGGEYDATIGTVLASFPALESVTLAGSPSITDEACLGLASITGLTSLDVGDASITDAGARLFLSLPRTMDNLSLPQSISDELILSLRLALGDVMIGGLMLSHTAARKLAAKAHSGAAVATAATDVKGPAWSE